MILIQQPIIFSAKLKVGMLFAVPVHCITQLFFLVLYILPLLDIPRSLRSVAVVVCILIAYFGNYLVTSIIFNWGNSYVEPIRRANFAATKEIISLLSGIVVSLAMGYALDSFIAADNISGGFIFIASVIGNVTRFILHFGKDFFIGFDILIFFL